jgi:hypothetical protein
MTVSPSSRSPGLKHLLVLGAGLALLCAAPAGAAGAMTWTAPGVARPIVSSTLEQCATSGAQEERSATFAGEMASVPGAVRMEMRIDVAERLPDQADYRTLSAPGLGIWRSSAPSVKAYRYLKQVTNLAGPAFYRGIVHFRWLGAHGRLLASVVLHTKRCEQPSTSVAAPPPAGTVSGSSAN